MDAAVITCFHCAEPLAGRAPLRARVGAANVVFCCPGCQAAAHLIEGLGLGDFYRFRTAPVARPDGVAIEYRAYDTAEMIASLTRGEPAARSVLVLIDGLTCAACSWLVTRALLRIDGVARASVNAATGRGHIVWDSRRVPLSQLLSCIDALGYKPRPVTADAASRQVEMERHAMLKRLIVAGLGMMQVMMFAVAMYSGNINGMDLQVRTYLRIVSMLVATPVMLYAGWPFFSGAMRALQARSVSMDVPVSLGLVLAYGASVLDTWRHAGEVYFDSVTMFIFFLTVARFVEMVARHRCNSVADSLSRLLPVTAHRFAADGGEGLIDVAVAQLAAGDRLLVRAGEVVPADGVILSGSTRVNESMLTGESIAVVRAPGEPLSAGTVNEEAPVQLRVTAVGGATTLANIVALLGRAQSERPKIMRAADASASRFLVRVLAGAVLVGVFWAFVDPARAFAATLAVLVVACPCALSLATLVAVASASAGLARRGVLVAHPDAIEALARASRVVFDKTGTLTCGRVRVTGVQRLAALPEAACLRLAAALEGHSEHPIARSFTALCPGAALATAVQVVPGAGIEGCIDGQRYRIGTRAFALGAAGSAAAQAAPDDAAICLGDSGGLLAAFTLADTLRPDAVGAVHELRAAGLAVELLSGDAEAAAGAVARDCGIGDYAARQTPQAKLRRITQLREAGEIVAMVGDGINDAPVLGGAGVAIAMGQGSARAQASAGLILVGDRLQALPEAVKVARRTRVIIRQNLAWASVYNLAAMPLAAMGWVPPWMAAIGMSLSSIGVVLNGMRAK